MSDVTATLRLESADLALTNTVTRVQNAVVQPVVSAGTVPNLGAHLFTVQTVDFDQFEAALTDDHTISSFERVVDLRTEAVYRFQYSPEATVFSAGISEVNGISLDWTNRDAAWFVQVWVPSREALATLCEYATANEIEFALERVRDHTNLDSSEPDLTPNQREALLTALEMGYFEEPRVANLEDVAAELGVSQPAAGGLLRRGFKRLLVSTVAEGTGTVAGTESN
ncbi:MAG: putative DNA binding protein [uncultured archaeon A07HR60]|jgi:Predicted DNA binding protein|nr:MAG: putative DNA binding protein [uncultured archaeon A07HR60]